ncbi:MULTISPECIES: PepSY domain-containing protein [Ornithinibacillus]|uniref:PepSY domain-containing protein n=2 Tax=Ornithinibacillus TaxID=484508 RepID=A0A923L6K4_9BACI|nr:MULTISPECIES: PepSY domain-containing protein [Ornithinibacillus]MBC5637346.1 PepSY domain-containing protein [Ornithinibacillus hominis]MBS3680347.1 PepSY domain-containing protein [Ornithinibacillus massiliensis]
MEQATFPNLITELQAIELAESVIEGTVVQMVLDVNKGIYIYELELKTKNGNTAIELNAITGEVIRSLDSR